MHYDHQMSQCHFNINATGLLLLKLFSVPSKSDLSDSDYLAGMKYEEHMFQKSFHVVDFSIVFVIVMFD